MAGKYSTEDLIKAFKHAKNNRTTIMNGKLCGCFSCKNIFHTYEIEHWMLGEFGDTALCPYCYGEAVIGEKSSFPITYEFLTIMNEHWYNGTPGTELAWWFY